VDIEGHMVNKLLVNGGAIVNILFKTMLKRIGEGEKDLVKNNIKVIDFNRRSLSLRGMITLYSLCGHPVLSQL